MRCGILPLVVSVGICITTLGCGGALGPAVSQHYQNHWLIINCHAETFDLKTGKTASAAPVIRSVVGDKVFGELTSDKGQGLLYCVPSDDGRYFACQTKDGALCVVDLLMHTCDMVAMPQADHRLGSVSWRPNSYDLLCLVFRGRPGDVRSGRLYFLARCTDKWIWHEIVHAGRLQAKPGEYEITERAWDSPDSFIYANNMFLRRYYVDTEQAEPCGNGHAAYGLGDSSFVYREGADPWSTFLIARKPGNTPEPALLQGGGSV